MIYKIFRIFFLCFFIQQVSFAQDGKFIFVPFKHAMDSQGENNSKTFKKFEMIFNDRNPDNFKSAGWPMIPKKIHQVWLYNTAIPMEISKSIQLWRQMYPDWEYKLWLLEDINALDFSTKDLYRKMNKVSEKLDLLRFEILNKFGGIFIDINYVPIQNMSYLNNYYKFYAGTEHLINDEKSDVVVSTAFIGSRRENLFLHKTLLRIREEFHKRSYYHYFTRDIFNEVIKEEIDAYKRAIIFPTSYFGIVLLDHPLISFVTKYIFFRDTTFDQRMHKETIAAKKKY